MLRSSILFIAANLGVEGFEPTNINIMNTTEELPLCETEGNGATGSNSSRTKCSTFVRMFQPRFAPLVEKGLKRQTVRKRPVRMPRTGDTLSLREWTGKPYRSKQRELKRVPLIAWYDVVIEKDRLRVWGGEMNEAKREEFARKDGFENWDEMVQWFDITHGLPFQGVLFTW